MMIGCVDIQTTLKIQKLYERKEKAAERLDKYRENTKVDERCMKRHRGNREDISSEYSYTFQSSTNPILQSEENVQKYSTAIIPSSISEAPSTSANIPRMKLPNLDGTVVSDRSVSILVNAALKDLGLVTKDDPSKVIDKSKIRRERIKRRSELKIHPEEKLVVNSIYFDGRKDKTLVQEKIGSKYYRKNKTEEHIVLISEPGSVYLGHVTLTGGNANSIKTSILNFLTNLLGDNLTKISAVGCDGTVVNTGYKNGVVRLLEVSVGKPLQWFICLLHTNELPLRHMMQYLDGKTNDPRGFTGVIGKSLETCEKLPSVHFEKIPVTLPEMNSNDLSTDQKYLYEMCKGISNGHISPSLALRGPGRMAHSSWLTTANRILRLYVATLEPSANLQIFHGPTDIHGPNYIISHTQ